MHVSTQVYHTSLSHLAVICTVLCREHILFACSYKRNGGVATRDNQIVYSDNGAYSVPDYELPAQSFTLDCSINTTAILT